ncbi:uncharacterized protein HaLaN_03273, partial [Haematococcus lacustris]
AVSVLVVVLRDGKPVGGARYYMGDVFYGRQCEGQQGRVRLTFFLGGGAIAAEELAYADSQGAPWEGAMMGAESRPGGP